MDGGPSSKGWYLGMTDVRTTTETVIVLTLLSEWQYRWLVKAVCWVTGIPIPQATHCAIAIRGTVYELTNKGVGICPYSQYVKQPQLRVVDFCAIQCDTPDVWLDRIRIAAVCNARIHHRDVAKILLRRGTRGLLCTSFLQLIMGLPLSRVPPTADQLMEQIRQTYYKQTTQPTLNL